MRIYTFKITLSNGKIAYADNPKRAARILDGYLNRGQIEEGEFPAEVACICNGAYRQSTAPQDVTGHFNNEGEYCCPHIGNTCGQDHPDRFYPWQREKLGIPDWKLCQDY